MESEKNNPPGRNPKWNTGIELIFLIQFQGKFMAIVVCWFLGLGSLVSWNSMLTISDYYYQIFPVSISLLLVLGQIISPLNNLFLISTYFFNLSLKSLATFKYFLHNCFLMLSPQLFVSNLYLSLQDYHPSRVLTIVYQPFALGTMAILAYHEAKIDTRKRNLYGYVLFCLSTFGLLLVGFTLSHFEIISFL